MMSCVVSTSASWAPADAAAHQADQLLADGQAQPGAAVATGGARLGLRELLEDAGQCRLGDADAGVRDGEAQVDMVLAGADRLDVQVDVAVLRELHGVVQQVHQHLAQAAGIQQHLLRHARCQPADQLEPGALRREGDEAGDFVHQRVQVGLDGIQFELAGLDLRQVEDVVDQAQQGRNRKRGSSPGTASGAAWGSCR
jgi:hypothetical protein